MNCEKCKYENRTGYCYHDIDERLGLETIHSFDDPKSSYSFDQFRIFKRKSDGALFYGTDSGCSCPSPFEDERFGTIDRLYQITPNSWNSFKTEFEAYAKHREGESYDPYRYVSAHEVIETLDDIRYRLYRLERA